MASYSLDVVRHHGTTVALTAAALRVKQWGYAETDDCLVVKTAAGATKMMSGNRLFHDLDDTTAVVLRAQAQGVARVEYSSSVYGSLTADSGGDLTISVTGSRVIIASGKTLRLGCAYQAGAPTPAGYVTIEDNTGTSYKISAEAA